MAKTAAERQRQKRKRDKDVTNNVTSVTNETERDVHPLDQLVIDTDNMNASLEHYQAYPEKYIPRREPDKLNWGPWMDVAGLEGAGLKANRVAIPGDWDYEGAAIFIPGLPLSMPQEAIA